jgi:hypothetical protein
MARFIAYLYNLLLHFTNRYMTPYVFSSPSSSTAASRDCLNYSLATQLLLFLNQITHLAWDPRYIVSGRTPQKTPSLNNSSIVGACRGNVFTEQLSSNGRLF